jgi:hypothetical protein
LGKSLSGKSCFGHFGEWAFGELTSYRFSRQILLKYEIKTLSIRKGSEGDRLLRCLARRGADLQEILQVVELVECVSKVGGLPFFCQGCPIFLARLSE